MDLGQIDQSERALPLQLTGWEFDTIILSLEAIETDDHQYRRNVQNLVVELARQLEQYLEEEA